MEKIDIDYSTKNIPVSSKDEYAIQLVSKIEHVIKRMRWKALEYLGKLNNCTKETYGFKSRKCPPTVKEMTNFEEDLRLMIKQLEYRDVKNEFLKKLTDDIKLFKNTKNMLINADKSRNIYKVSSENYKKYLVQNITKTYEKSNKARVNSINKDTKKLAEKLKIAD